MTFGLSTLKRTITKKSKLPRCIDIESIATWALTVFVVGPALLFWFATYELDPAYRERLELLLPLVILGLALILSVAGGPLLAERVRGRGFRILGLSLVCLVLVVNILTRPPANLEYLWFGFGRRVLACSLLAFTIWTVVVHIRKLADGFFALRIVVTLVMAAVYLPALIQPPWGIINLGDASHQVMEEISGPLVGHFPGINFVSTYTTLLGIPLLVFRPFSFSHSSEMTIVVSWINFLVLALPALLVGVGRRVGSFRSWMVGLLFVVPPLMVSGKWGSAASNVESLSMIPGRTLLPVVLGLVVIHMLSRPQTSSFVFVGALATIVAFNNIEFGAPAAIAASLCVVTMITTICTAQRLRNLLAFLLGTISTLAILFFGSLLVDGKYDFWFRVGSYSGKPYSPAEIFPVWSTHNLLLGFFATGIVVGITVLKRLSAPGLCAIFFGTWGLTAFPYCSYRCLEGMYMATQVYFVPAIGAVLGIVGCLRASISSSKMSMSTKFPVFVMVLGSFAVGCLIQAPNPRDEWIRVLGRAQSMPWASDSRRGLPSEWTTSKIDWLETGEINDARRQITDDSVGYFGYMGNSVQLATGINNLSRINSSEVLQIKGTKKLRELACREVDETQPRYVILVGMEFPCSGYLKTDAFTVADGLQVLMRQGK